MIRIYIFNRKEYEELSFQEDFLTSDRREKIARMKRQEDKELAACAELLLIYGLRHFPDVDAVKGRDSGNAPEAGQQIQLPLKLTKDERGKLAFLNLPYFFNYSHARDFAVCAVSDRPVGVDIEYFRVREIAAADRILHPKEAELLAFISNPDEKKKYFYECWVAKESYLKNLGIGLIVRPGDFMVNEDRLMILDKDVSQLKGHHSINAGSQVLALKSKEKKTEQDEKTKNKDTTLHENLSYLEKRYVHVFEPGEVRGTDWKFDAGYRIAACGMEGEKDILARQIHAEDIMSVIREVK